MPSAQVIDLNYKPRTQPTTLESTLSSFSNQFAENSRAKQETDALKEIYAQYQNDGENLQRKIQAVQSDARIGPTTRVNTVKQLMDFQKYNGELQKKAATDMQKAELEKKKVEANKAILSDLESRRKLKPGELSAYENDPKMAEQISRPEKQSRELLSNQPIDPDQLRRVQHVRSQPGYTEASPGIKYQMLTDSGVSAQNAEKEAKIFAEDEKSKPGQEYGKLREKAVSEYVTSSLAKREHAEESKYTLDTARNAINGDVTGPGYQAIVKNNPYGQLMFGLTPDESSLQAANKKLLETSKGIFGSKPTEREIFLLLNSMLPAIGRSKESNLASLNFIERLNDLNVLHGDIVEDISKDGYVPDIEAQVNKRMKPYIDEYLEDLKKGVKAVKEVEDSKAETSAKIKVKAPDGKTGYMTQKQIDEAKAKNVIFKPI